MPRPTRPRSWCSCASPKRSACSITISDAFGTSTPTSITVVATSNCTSLRENASITAAFSAGASRPCTSPTFSSGSAAASVS
ncbi:ATP-dependent DNA helicase RecG [Burkholderia pseudomallei MSHR7527]|nr:ATP-dependent DNA helicase RecG [Burkholderia pseudomallei MSHR7527]